MSVQHQVNQQLAALSQGGGEALRLNERGLCAIEIADEYEGHIYVPPTDNLVVFCLSVAPVTLDDRAALYAHLLAMNYLDEETQGAALCLDPTHSDILLRYSLPAEHLQHDSVARLLGALHERVTALAASLSEWQREQALAKDKPEDAPAQFDPTQFV